MPLTLPELIDVNSLQLLMERFLAATGIPVGIIGSDGKILVATGWQEMCTCFHRRHPVTAERCRQSDAYIKTHLPEETYIQYKCSNGLWDIAIPIVIAGEHLATIFLGQFFYEDETIDEEFFQSQAREFGFDLDRYMAALRRIPIFSRENVRNIMDYYSSFAHFLVRMGLANYRHTETEKTLRASEEKFSKAFHATPTVLVISTPEGRYLEVNESFEKTTGYRRDEAIGRTSIELNIWERPEERARFMEALHRFGNVRDLEFNFRTKGGKILRGLLSAEVIDSKGEERLLILVNDISGRKSAEEALKASEAEKSLILNSTLDLIVYHDTDMNIIWANKKACDSVQTTPEKLEGRHCWEIWQMRTEPCPGCPVIAARDTGKQQEAEIRSPDGKHWYIRGFPVKNDDGDVKGVVEFCLDVSERKCADEEIEVLNTHLASHALELEQARDDLEKRVAERTAELARTVEVLTNEIHERRQVEKNLKEETTIKLQTMENLRMKDQLLMQQSRQAAMGEMIGNIAHQWRQPLNNIGLLVQELRLRFEWGDLTRQDMDLLVEKSMEMISHMSQTIDDFRNFFRPEKEKVVFTVSQVVTKTLSLIEKSLKNQGIDIFLEQEGNPVISGFPNEFSQVMINILSNARDALAENMTDNPSIYISVSEQGGKAVITIRDNAGGVPKSIIDKIFDPYFSTKAPDQGTGVGLFMAKTIIEKNMNGILDVCNTGGGAEFRIEL